MRDRDLPLFNWNPPTTIIPFPAAARIGEARHVARVFANQGTAKARAAYWKRTIATFRRRLTSAGISADTIQQHVDEFRDLVECELARIAPADRDRQPDGAA